MRDARGPCVALAGGGTGGHLFPGLEVARTLLGEDGRPVLFGSGRAREADWVGTRARRIPLDSPMLPRRGTEVPGYCWRLLRAVGVSLGEIRRRRPALVMGLGGYASVAPGIAALLARRPLLLLEQNVVPGKANRLLARLGGRVAAAHAESLDYLPRRARDRSRVVGNPVRRSLFAGRRDPARFGLAAGRPVLLVMGGSQGARELNRRVLAAADRVAARGAQVIHLTGPRDLPAARRAWSAVGVRAFCRGFLEGMGDAYATADLVVCRAGGTTLAELAALGKAAVLVPYPHHADRHQERNARAAVRAGAARLVREAELDPARFEAEVLDLLDDREARRRMEAAGRRLGAPDAARRAAEFARELAREGRR